MQATAPKFELLRKCVSQARLVRISGRVTQVVGLLIEADGPNARVGDVCWIETEGSRVRAEVVGFRGDRTLLMPLGRIDGVRAGRLVRDSGFCLRVPVGDRLLGRTLNGLGDPIDGLGALHAAQHYPVLAQSPAALNRPMIDKPLHTGVRAIDALLTLCEGQRVGVFSGSGVGKSTLLGMLARHCVADVNIIALVGERGREVREFLERDLRDGLGRSVVVVATSDEPALVRIKAALTATALAEWFRDQGKKVLLLMDSITRLATAQRELGLAIGEPPSTRGYTPSVFALLPSLMERAGTSERGSITAVYSVLVEGDDNTEPIADTARSVLDGHLVLSRRLAEQGHYPPIDVLQSLSRTMPFAVHANHARAARKFRELTAAYQDVEDLVSIGAYKPGAKPIADEAIRKREVMAGFLRQDKDERASPDESIAQLAKIVGDEI